MGVEIAAKSPLCPAGHLPHKGGDKLLRPLGLIKRLIWVDVGASSSPPLWGRCRQAEGESHTHRTHPSSTRRGMSSMWKITS